MKKTVIIVFLIFSFANVEAQEPEVEEPVYGIVKGNDTIIHRRLRTIYVFPDKKATSKRYQRRYSRYVAKVKRIYPLAVEARELLKEYEPKYYALEKQSDRRKLMKNLEKELLDKHKEELKKWSISDGKILLKLINRETEHTPYELIKDFRGSVSAVFWQGIARLFRNNLKDEYDPDNDDRMLEEIVTLVELGYL